MMKNVLQAIVHSLYDFVKLDLHVYYQASSYERATLAHYDQKLSSHSVPKQIYSISGGQIQSVTTPGAGGQTMVGQCGC